MAVRRSVAVPTPVTALPDTHRLPSTNPTVIKQLSRLSRPSLISLAQGWLEDRNLTLCQPYLLRDEDELDDLDEDAFPAGRSIRELREIYEDLAAQKGPKNVVVERITEGDWRHGLNLFQLAQVDIQHLHDHPLSQKWTAQKLVRVVATSGGELDVALEDDPEKAALPKFNARRFLGNLQREIQPLVKAHYYVTRAEGLDVTLVRIQLHDSPYTSQSALQASSAKKDSSTTIYLGFPDGAAMVYISLSGSPGDTNGAEGRNLRRIMLETLPNCLSHPQHRYALRPTNLSAKSLAALLAMRGGGRGNAALGGWSIFADNTVDKTPLSWELPTPPPSDPSSVEEEKTLSMRPKRHIDDDEAARRKRRKLVAEGRFGTSGIEDDGKGIEKLEIRMEDRYPVIKVPNDSGTEETVMEFSDADDSEPEDPSTQSHRGRPSTNAFDEVDKASRRPRGRGNEWVPSVRLRFNGTHIFAGIRRCVEEGIMDGINLPGWMTGEEGVSIGVVRNGRIRAGKGSGA